MAISSKRVPSLTASANYAQFGSWKTDLKAYLSYNDMQLWSSLDESKMPDAFPATIAEDAAGYDEYVAQTTRFKSRYDIDDEWSFLASSGPPRTLRASSIRATCLSAAASRAACCRSRPFCSNFSPVCFPKIQIAMTNVKFQPSASV